MRSIGAGSNDIGQSDDRLATLVREIPTTVVNFVNTI